MAKVRTFGRIFLNLKHADLAIAEIVYHGKNKVYKRNKSLVVAKVIKGVVLAVSV